MLTLQHNKFVSSFYPREIFIYAFKVTYITELIGILCRFVNVQTGKLPLGEGNQQLNSIVRLL